MKVKIKKYDEYNIKLCKEFVFGYTRFFKDYIIEENDFDIYLIGKNQISKNVLFMSVNRTAFLKECKKIGRELCDLFFKEFTSNFEILHNEFENVVLIEPYLVTQDLVKKNIRKIEKIIGHFISTYGIPVNNELINSLYCNISLTTSIGLRELCTYFILINIISDLAFFDKFGIKIETYYDLFKLDKTESNEEIISKLFTIELFHMKHIGEYYIKYINNNPVCYTSNLFTFAFDQLKHSIIKRKNNVDIDVEIRHTQTKKEPKSKKELSRSTSETYYSNQTRDYKRLLTYRNTIKKYDINKEYTDLISKLSEVKKIKDIKRKIHTPLIEEANHIALKLKKEYKNDSN